MALTTYININNHGDPITVNMIDSATASSPTDRPSMFTPTAGYPTSTTANDYSVGTTPTVRPQCFEPPSYSASLDPGLVVSG